MYHIRARPPRVDLILGVSKLTATLADFEKKMGIRFTKCVARDILLEHTGR